MPDPLKIVVVGGVAAGPKAASKVKRLMPDAEVILIEKGALFSFAGCGLPYYVSEVVHEQKDLMATPVGAVRDTAFFQKVKGVRVLNRTEAIEIDREGKQVRIRALESGEESWLPYDKLMLATGAGPVVPPIPGVERKGVYTLHSIEDAERVKASLAEGRVRNAVIIGGGLIGIETAEALAAKGCQVTLVEMLPHILAMMLDFEMARLVELHMQSKGVRIMADTKALAIVGEGDAVSSVQTDKGQLPAEAVILAVGVRPRTELAMKAGLAIGEKTHAIVVDECMRTSDPDIYAAGDCVECKDRITGQPCFVPLGSTANKQGRVAAINMCGGHDTFPGVFGSTVCKVFDFCVGRTGLTEKAARANGYDAITVLSPGADRAHYMPTAKTLMIKLIASRATRKLLGLQVVGPGAGDKRVDVAAMALAAGMTVDQLAKADLCYAPPFSGAMDNIITAADIARNKLDGQMASLTPMEVRAKLDAKEDFVFLDVRSPGEWEEVRLPGSMLIPLGALRERSGELPRDKEIVAFCKASLRGYEAARILLGQGFTDVKVMDGGVAMWPFAKEK